MIEIKNLEFSYKKTPVFSDINLSFPDGGIYGLLGENGVGKTTLLKLICGLLRPVSGTCTLDGQTCHDRLPSMLQRIVFLPDEVALPEMSTPQRYVDELQPFYPAFSQSKFLHLMQELEVDPARRFREMSFGQQKKSIIAATLALGTDYILLDEPTNGLDIPSKSQFRRVVAQNMIDERTILISTHQVHDVEALLDHILILSHRALLLNAPVADLTARYTFSYRPVDDGSAAVYSEPALQGRAVMAERREGDAETQLNLELLFNAVTKGLVK